MQIKKNKQKTSSALPVWLDAIGFVLTASAFNLAPRLFFSLLAVEVGESPSPCYTPKSSQLQPWYAAQEPLPSAENDLISSVAAPSPDIGRHVPWLPLMTSTAGYLEAVGVHRLQTDWDGIFTGRRNLIARFLIYFRRTSRTLPTPPIKSFWSLSRRYRDPRSALWLRGFVFLCVFLFFYEIER